MADGPSRGILVLPLRSPWRFRVPRAAALGAVALLSGEGAAAQESRPDEPESAPASPASRPAEEKTPTFDLGGYLDVRYRYRSVPGGQTDQDLFGSFGVRTSLPGYGDGDLRLVASGSFVWDLDQFPDVGNPFSGLSETYDGRLLGYLYEAYGEVDPEGPIRTLRAGRQVLWREEGIRFDGVYAEALATDRTEISLYGGVPVHFYESSPDGDLLAGAGFAISPARRLRVSIDGIYVRDRRDVPGVPSVEGDLLTVLAVEGSPDPRIRARGTFSMLDAKERRETAEIYFFDPASRIRMNARLVRQNDITDIPVTEFSPYAAVLGVLEPYFQFQVDAGAPIVEPLEVALGYARRELIEGADEGLFNHEFDHGYAIATLVSFPWPETSLNVRGDGWNAGGEDVLTLGGGVEARFGEKEEWRAEVGTDYSLYRVDFFTGEERLRDRVYYGRVRRRLGEHLDLGLAYRYERDDLDEYHVADLVVGLRF